VGEMVPGVWMAVALVPKLPPFEYMPPA
jgi:hypothetical protein